MISMRVKAPFGEESFFIPTGGGPPRLSEARAERLDPLPGRRPEKDSWQTVTNSNADSEDLSQPPRRISNANFLENERSPLVETNRNLSQFQRP